MRITTTVSCVTVVALVSGRNSVSFKPEVAWLHCVVEGTTDIAWITVTLSAVTAMVMVIAKKSFTSNA